MTGREGGMSLAAISSMLGCSQGEVMEILQRHRISFTSVAGAIYVPIGSVPAIVGAYAESREG